MPRPPDPCMAGRMNFEQWSLFDEIAMPLTDTDMPLAGYTDLELDAIIEAWKKE